VSSLLETVSTTLQALIQPRRAAAITVVAAPLLYTQWAWSWETHALRIGILLVASTIVVGPTAWRWLVPMDERVSWLPLRLLLYAAIGAADLWLCAFGLPRWLDARDTFLTATDNLPVLYGMFLVGGWGLGRDIDQEISLKRERARAVELEREKMRAELLAVRSHLDPHFLFNTLNAIAEWCQQDPAVAEKALVTLAGILRTVLGAIRDPAWPLQREIELCRDVGELHRIRDPERFQIRIDGEVPAIQVPPMLLLPVIENAMKHGPGAGHRGVVTIGVEVVKGKARITVINPGPYQGPRPGGEGISMVRQRLELAYGPAAAFDIGAEGDTTRAVVTIPMEG
jgi:two-component system sensor histidine kinase AlgZ